MLQLVKMQGQISFIQLPQIILSTHEISFCCFNSPLSLYAMQTLKFIVEKLKNLSKLIFRMREIMQNVEDCMDWNNMLFDHKINIEFSIKTHYLYV